MPIILLIECIEKLPRKIVTKMEAERTEIARAVRFSFRAFMAANAARAIGSRITQ